VEDGSGGGEGAGVMVRGVGALKKREICRPKVDTLTIICTVTRR